MMLALYKGLTFAGGPLIALYLAGRRRRGREDTGRFRERLGIPGRARPEGPLVWLHAASVGETLSVLPLIERLDRDRPDLGLLMTTGTVTSAHIAAGRLPERAIHQYVPVDRGSYVRRFLDHWRPDATLWIESEFWPNLLSATQARAVPLALVNGRVSDRSYARWQRWPGLIRTLLGGFALSLGQTERDAERLRKLGARNAKCVGNLKSAAPPLPADEAALADLRAALGSRPRWLAASTHAGEEEIAGEVHKGLAGRFPGLVTLVVPRHPYRGAAIAAALRGRGLGVAQRSADEAIGPETDVYVADTLGELGIFYRLAGVVFVGGSLVPHGGQNPLEPARLDSALLFGPHMMNFREMTEALLAAGAAQTVADGEALTDEAGRLIGDDEARRAAAEATERVAAHRAGALERVLAAIAPHLPAEPESEANVARA